MRLIAYFAYFGRIVVTPGYLFTFLSYNSALKNILLLLEVLATCNCPIMSKKPDASPSDIRGMRGEGRHSLIPVFGDNLSMNVNRRFYAGDGTRGEDRHSRNTPVIQLALYIDDFCMDVNRRSYGGYFSPTGVITASLFIASPGQWCFPAYTDWFC